MRLLVLLARCGAYGFVHIVVQLVDGVVVAASPGGDAHFDVFGAMGFDPCKVGDPRCTHSAFLHFLTS